MEFSKTIFQAWKVMKNSQGHGKSWKIMMISRNLSRSCRMSRAVNEVVLDRLFCNTEILVNTYTYTCGFIL